MNIGTSRLLCSPGWWRSSNSSFLARNTRSSLRGEEGGREGRRKGRREGGEKGRREGGEKGRRKEKEKRREVKWKRGEGGDEIENEKEG